MLKVSLGPDNTLAVAIPSDLVRRSRTVNIPLTVDGLRVLQRLLHEREEAEVRTVGTEAAPTQLQIEAWLRADREAKKAKEAEENAALAAKYGIDLEDLGL